MGTNGRKPTKPSIEELRELLSKIADDREALELVARFVALLAKRSRVRRTIQSD
jgi:hypothetical protein